MNKNVSKQLYCCAFYGEKNSIGLNVILYKLYKHNRNKSLLCDIFCNQKHHIIKKKNHMNYQKVIISPVIKIYLRHGFELIKYYL